MDPLDLLAFLDWGKCSKVNKELWLHLASPELSGLARQLRSVLRTCTSWFFPLETRAQRAAHDRRVTAEITHGLPQFLFIFRFIYPSIPQHPTHRGKMEFYSPGDSVPPSPFSPSSLPPSSHTFSLALSVWVLGLPEHSKTEAISSCLAHIAKKDR